MAGSSGSKDQNVLAIEPSSNIMLVQKIERRQNGEP